MQSNQQCLYDMVVLCTDIIFAAENRYALRPAKLWELSREDCVVLSPVFT